MRIAVNTRLLLKGRLEGIGWYTAQMLQRLVTQHPEHEFIFFFDRPWDESFIYGPNVTPVVAHPQARHPVLFYLWFEMTLPRLMRRMNVDLFLSPDGMGSLRTKVPQCLVIHDLAFEHYPEFMPASHLYYMQRNTPRWARKAKEIVTVSEFSRQDIAARYDIPLDKITVTPNGAHPAYRPLSAQEQEAVRKEWTGGAPYFLFAGALHPRKNVLALLHAFVQFKKRMRCGMKLVIVGRLAWKTDDLVNYRDTMPFKEDVIWAGYQDVEALSSLTAAAYAVVYPSLFEGFGIPILEGLKCGVPAIVSNTSSMPEVGGDAALLIDPTDVDDLAAKLGMMYKDEALRAELAAKAQAQSEKFSWDKSAEILWKAMMKAAE